MLSKASDYSLPGKENLGKFIPPLIMTVILATVYISLSHYHVKSLREKEELKSDLNELRSEYISLKSKLMKQSKQSEVAEKLKDAGIRELRTPPVIIEDKKSE